MSKKFFLKIPKNIQAKIKNIQSNDIVVGILKTFTQEDIRNGVLSHLNIFMGEDSLVFPEEIVPNANQGKFSYRNIFGYEKVRKDLGLETRYRTMDVPSWGSSYDTHEVEISYKAYPREYVSPRFLTIKIECRNTLITLDKYAIKFEISEVLDKASSTFENNLLTALNLLQESLYASDVFASKSSYEDYLRTVQLAWEFLPPGNREDDIRRIFGQHFVSKEKSTDDESRYDFMLSLKPKQFLVGSSGFQRYFGALLEDDLVIFENIAYGNAIYIMHKNWEQLSTLSRLDLLSGKYGDNFERVIHINGWENKVKAIVKEYRHKLI